MEGEEGEEKRMPSSSSSQKLKISTDRLSSRLLERFTEQEGVYLVCVCVCVCVERERERGKYGN